MRLRIQPKFWGIVIVLMLIAFGTSYAFAQHRLSEGEQALAMALSQRESLQQQVANLSEALEFVQTDEYVIRVARDELSMIMPGEIRYINGN